LGIISKLGLGAMTQLFSLAFGHGKSEWISFEKGFPSKSTVCGPSKQATEGFV
jgi:hypothetical protein